MWMSGSPVGTRAPAASQYRLPSYTSVDLRTSLTVKTVDLQLYVRNAFDRRAQLFAYTWQGTPTAHDPAAATIGVMATAKF